MGQLFFLTAHWIQLFSKVIAFLSSRAAVECLNLWVQFKYELCNTYYLKFLYLGCGLEIKTCCLMPETVTKIFLVFGWEDLEHRLCQVSNSGYFFLEQNFAWYCGNLSFLFVWNLCIVHSVFICLTFFVCVLIFLIFFPSTFSNGSQ